MEFDHPGIEESKSSTEQTYDVVFQDGPLGLELDEQFGLARAKEVTEGGQAAKGGVEANDLIMALDSGTVTFDEAWAVINSRPRPITVSFRRAKPATVESPPQPRIAPQPGSGATENETHSEMAGSANVEMYLAEFHI